MSENQIEEIETCPFCGKQFPAEEYINHHVPCEITEPLPSETGQLRLF